jgi:von Willebrand factor type A domain
MNQFLAETVAKLHEQYAKNNISDRGEGLESVVYATLNWPSWFVSVLVLASVTWFIFTARREQSSAIVWRKGFILGLRLLAIATLGFMLQGWMHQQHKTDLPELIIAFDVSHSMNTVDSLSEMPNKEEWLARLKSNTLTEPTRLNLAKLLLLENQQELLDALTSRFRVRLVAMGEQTKPITQSQAELSTAIRHLQATDNASKLGQSLREILETQRGRSTAAILLFTDGITTEGKPLSEIAEYARHKTIPLYTIGIGNEYAPRDVRLIDLLVEEQAFVNDMLTFEVKLSASSMQHRSGKVQLKVIGQSEVLAEQAITLTQEQETQTLKLNHRPNKEGIWNYELILAGFSQDTQPENNRVTSVVQVHNTQVRVLFVQGAPSYEYRFLKTMLERELNQAENTTSDSLGFRVVLQDADLKFAETDKSALPLFPISRDELFQYDVLILGDADPTQFSPTVLNNINDFVLVRGGGMIAIAGPRFNPLAYHDTPLATLFPIELETARIPLATSDLTTEIRPLPTALGLASTPLQLVDNPVENLQLWTEKLPGMYWWTESPDLRAGARVLLQHPTQSGESGSPLPLLTMHYIGAGRVMFQGFDSSYRWRYRVGDKYFSRYWIQMIRLMARGKIFANQRASELVSDRKEYRRGETVSLRLKFFDERLAPAEEHSVVLAVEREGMPRRTLSASRVSSQRGIFEASMTNLGEGVYRTWLLSPTVSGEPPSQEFRILAPPGEQARLELDRKELQSTAETSGGKFSKWHATEELFAQLPPGRPVRIEALPPTPIWNSPVLAGLFVLFLVTEWVARKLWGML